MVAHDAGAARLLQSWMAPLGPQLCFCLEGPALSLFEAERGTLDRINLQEGLQDCQLLISGSGWSSTMEHDSRCLAAALGIPSIAVLDHWVNYLPRFQRRGETMLPDGLWVADAEAAALARRILPGIPITQLPNRWLEMLKSSVQRERQHLGRTGGITPAKNLLYLLEPLRDQNSGLPNGEEFAALDYWISKLPGLIASGLVAEREQLQLRLRPHPSEAPGKYNTWIKQQPDQWPVILDKNHGLDQSLAEADLTFGCETQALVAAMACDLKAFSTLPPSAPPCRLPHKQLQNL